jgi:CheY-like chemotaxis protein
MVAMSYSVKKKIMVVDDNLELLDELVDLLSDNGYDTTSFSSGTPALNEARKSPPDLILLDLKMDGKSGFTVAQELSSRPGTAGIPILGMTGYYSGHMYATLMSIIGFCGCLTKPLDPEKLLSRIAELLEEQNSGRMPPPFNGKGEDSTERGM